MRPMFDFFFIYGKGNNLKRIIIKELKIILKNLIVSTKSKTMRNSIKNRLLFFYSFLLSLKLITAHAVLFCKRNQI